MKILVVSPKLISQKRNVVKKFVQRAQVVEILPSEIFCAYAKSKSATKNNIVMKQDIGKSHYTFYDEDKNIGYAVFEKAFVTKAKKGDKPSDWYVSEQNDGLEKTCDLKPYIYIDELVIEDRVGLTGDYTQRKSGKKQGTMCLQKILEWARKNGYGSRLSLVPGKTYSDIAPHKFYAKIGFEMSPNDIKKVERIEEKYSKEPCLFRRNKNEKVSGRWVSKGQELFLTNPDVLENYPLD